MANVVMIHGIAQENNRAEVLENEWRSALAAGVVTSGAADVGGRIGSASQRSNAVDVRMAYYGDLFIEQGAQGDGSRLDHLDAQERALAKEIAKEWIHRASSRGTLRDKNEANSKIGHLESGEDQGLREDALRWLVNGVAGLRWFAPFGMRVAERFVVRSLVQVTKYLGDQDLRSRIQQRVLDQIGDDTRIIIGHSLGSVIAYEVAAQLDRPLPLLITLGSPLGLRTIIYDKVLPHPPVFPPNVHRWVNIADTNDLVAAEPDLSELFPVRDTQLLESKWLEKGPGGQGALLNGVVNNGPEPHSAIYYLKNWQVGVAVSRVLN